MKNKIYDSKETLEAGIQAEKATIVEYTQYLNLAKKAGNESEVKLWEHIIKDEEEHVKEFENALKGDFNLIDSDPEESHIISGKSMEQIAKEQERSESFHDDLINSLIDGGIDKDTFTIDVEEYPWAYVDFGDNEKECRKAYEVLRDDLFDAHFVNDEGSFYISIKRR